MNDSIAARVFCPARIETTILFGFALLCGYGLPAPASGEPSHVPNMGVEAASGGFVDVVKEYYRWEKPDGKGSWSALAAGDVTERGWPKGDCRWIMDSRPVAEWAGQVDDPDTYRIDRHGVYHGSFTGNASIVAGGDPCSIANVAYHPEQNRTTFELTIPAPEVNHGLLTLEFRDTRATADAAKGTGITDFRLLRPGYADQSNQLFTREYLACLKSAAFSAVRFMNVTNTNGNVEWGKDHTRLQMWGHRKLPTDASVGAMEVLNKKDGWPWEDVIALCNEAGMDAWINIPASVDEEYIRQLAALFKASLKPNLNIYIEDSNEIWNFGFIQYAWNMARAKEEVAEGKVRYDFDHVNDPNIWGQRRHAQRVVDCVRIFAESFGAGQINKRVRGVVAGVTPDPNGFFICGRLASMLDYLKAVDGDPKSLIYAISIPAYYGGKAAAGEKGTENASVDDILAGMKADIERTKADREAMVRLARRFDLPGGYCAYESGPDTGGGKTVNLANRIRAIRDPRQKQVYIQNFAEAFWGIGGNLAMQFTLSGPYCRFGTYGLTDDLSKPDRNAMFQAVREMIGPGR